MTIFHRKTSHVKSEECPKWNPYEGIWMESDFQLQERIKEGIREEVAHDAAMGVLREEE